MADRYVMHDGQLCRVTESFESVDVAQLELTVTQHENALAERKSELEQLQNQLDAKTIEVEDAESVLEDSKRNVASAHTLVGDPSDGDETDGAGSEVSHLNPEPVF